MYKDNALQQKILFDFKPESDSILHYAKSTQLAQGEIFKLVGHGVKGKDCGELIGYYCSRCERVFYLKKDCMLRSCPYCYKKWGAKESGVIKYRLLDGKRKFGGRLMHIVLSPPQNEWSRIVNKSGYKKMRKKVYRMLRKHGVKGGSIIFHEYRDSEVDGVYNVWGPHFHCFVLANWVSSGKDVFVETGWVLKVIRDKNNKVKLRTKTMRRKIFYALEHSSYLENVHSVTWFGSLSYNQMKKGKLETEFREGPYRNVKRCPICGKELILWGEWDRTSYPWDFVTCRVRGGVIEDDAVLKPAWVKEYKIEHVRYPIGQMNTIPIEIWNKEIERINRELGFS